MNHESTSLNSCNGFRVWWKFNVRVKFNMHIGTENQITLVGKRKKNSFIVWNTYHRAWGRMVTNSKLVDFVRKINGFWLCIRTMSWNMKVATDLKGKVYWKSNSIRIRKITLGSHFNRFYGQKTWLLKNTWLSIKVKWKRACN